MEESLQNWELISAFVLPLVLAAVMGRDWSSSLKAVVMFVVSSLVVMIQLYLHDELNDWNDPVASILKVVAFTIAFYQGFWKPTGVTPKIEAATTITTETKPTV